MTLLKKLAFTAPVVAAFLAIAVQPAHASLLYTLDLGNPGISAYTGPYATVDVARVNATTATILFTALDSVNGQHFLFGDGGSVDLNVNGTGLSYSGLSFTQPATINGNPPVTPLPYSQASGNADGWGSYSFQLDASGGFTSSVRTLSFTLTATSASWATDADVLTANNKGYFAAAHIFVANSTYTNDALSTGFATNQFPPVVPHVETVPEPASLAVWGLLALAGVAYGRRRNDA